MRRGGVEERRVEEGRGGGKGKCSILLYPVDGVYKEGLRNGWVQEKPSTSDTDTTYQNERQRKRAIYIIINIERERQRDRERTVLQR